VWDDHVASFWHDHVADNDDSHAGSRYSWCAWYAWCASARAVDHHQHFVHWRFLHDHQHDNQCQPGGQLIAGYGS